MIDRNNAPEFILEGNRLTVRGEMAPENEVRFSHELSRLLGSALDELELNLTQMHRMSSAYVGATCLFLLVAKKDGLRVTIRANEGIAEVLRTSGVHEMADVTVAT